MGETFHSALIFKCIAQGTPTAAYSIIQSQVVTLLLQGQPTVERTWVTRVSKSARHYRKQRPRNVTSKASPSPPANSIFQQLTPLASYSSNLHLHHVAPSTQRVKSRRPGSTCHIIGAEMKGSGGLSQGSVRILNDKVSLRRQYQNICRNGKTMSF